MDVGSNPGKIVVFFMYHAYVNNFFFFFPSCSMLYLLSPRLCFFIVFNLNLFVKREDSLMS